MKGSALLEEELREYLAHYVPHYMIPPVLIFLDEIPLTPNRKVDEGALPPPVSRPGDATRLAPRHELERTLAELWSRLLKTENIGVRDNFFKLGGHSLHVMRLLSEIRKRHDVDVPAQSFFERPTIECLAARIRERTHVR